MRYGDLIVDLDSGVFLEAVGFSLFVKHASCHLGSIAFVKECLRGCFYANRVAVYMSQDDEPLVFGLCLPLKFVFEADYSMTRNVIRIESWECRRLCEVGHFRSFLQMHREPHHHLLQRNPHTALREHCCSGSGHPMPFGRHASHV